MDVSFEGDGVAPLELSPTKSLSEADFAETERPVVSTPIRPIISRASGQEDDLGISPIHSAGTEELDRTLPYAYGRPVEAFTDLRLRSMEPVPTETDEIKSSPEIETAHFMEREGNDFCGYTLCFDDVNLKVGVRHQKKSKQPKIFSMVQLYAAKDRLPSFDLSNESPSVQDILDIPLSEVLPTNADVSSVKKELCLLVSRILSEHMEVFREVDDKVVKSIKHKYSEESLKKSEMVPLGVLDKDETKTADMVEILRSYTQYVPSDTVGSPIQTILYGDGLSCERGVDGKGGVVNAETKWERLEGWKA